MGQYLGVTQATMMENEEASAKLRNAVKYGNLEKVKEALKVEGVNPNSKPPRDITGHTPLTHAVELGRNDILTVLLENPEVDVNAKGIDGMTPLCLAISLGIQGIVKLLLENPQTDPNLKEGGGMTPIHLAVSCNYSDVLEVLLKHPKLDTEAVMADSDMTALQLAQSIESIDPKIIKMFP